LADVIGERVPEERKGGPARELLRLIEQIAREDPELQEVLPVLERLKDVDFGPASATNEPRSGPSTRK